MLKDIFLPWLVIHELRASHTRMAKRAQEWADRTWTLQLENHHLRSQLAKFDHDGDGKPGGSRKR